MGLRETPVRVLTGAALGLFCLGWVFFAPEPLYLALCLGFLLLATLEYRKILGHRGLVLRPLVLFGSVLMGFSGLWFYWQGMRFQGNLAMVFAWFNPLSYAFLRTPDKKAQAFWMLLPQAWLVGPVFLLAYIRYLPPEPLDGAKMIFWLALVVAGNDIAAYFGGKRFGKTPLAPKISPKKTREGSAFGIFGGLFSGLALSPELLPILAPWEVVVVVVVVVAAAQVGDLAESAFKRFGGVKDSGKILPGHGGVLDRFDALLTAIPVFYGLIYLLGLDQRW